MLAEAAPVVEPVSLDEAFLEPPALAGAAAAEVERFGVELRAAVRRAHRAARVGRRRVGQAARQDRVGAGEARRAAGGRARPRSATVLAPLPVRALWGVGPVAEAALRRMGVQTIGELAATDLRELTGLLGAAVGTELHRLARGVDDRPVAPRGAAKQVSAETTFDADLTAMAAVQDAVARIAEAAHRRLVASGRAARTVTVKVRSADFTTTSRSETTAAPSTDLAALTATAQRLVRAAVPDGGVRLIGVSLAGLTDSPPPALFEATAPARRPPSNRPPSPAEPTAEAAVARPWRAGDDVRHPEHGHGWVQGAGHGRVTVRFETRSTGPGRAVTLAADDPALTAADPLDSLR